MSTIGNVIHFMQVIDSTNDHFIRLNKSYELNDGEVIWAHEQVKGRGQTSNSWQSNAGENLTMSIFLNTQFLDPAKQFYLSMALSLGVIDFFASKEIAAEIKWPNDILVNKKKIVGILIEHEIQGSSFSHSIAGLGVNVNQTVFTDLPMATSMMLEKNKGYKLDVILPKLCAFIDVWYDKLKHRKFEEIHNAYISQLYGFNQMLTFTKKGKKFEGKIIDVDEMGQLSIQKANGEINVFQFKEVEFVL